MLAAERAGMECGRRRYAGRRRRSVGSRLAAKAKAAEAMVVAARSMEVVMEVKGTAAQVKRQAERGGSGNSKTANRLSECTLESHCRRRRGESVPHVTRRRAKRVFAVRFLCSAHAP